MELEKKGFYEHFVPVCVSVENLISDLVVIIKNTSRDSRVIVGVGVIEKAWQLHERLTRAGRVKPKLKVLGDAVIDLDILRSKIRVAYETGAMPNKTKRKIFRQLAEIGAFVGAWYKQERERSNR